ncbi:MAG: hypothetical protein N2314_07975 [Brevinematales bacterium]|nr:hypothetical protein [Brevinematales bacterium]
MKKAIIGIFFCISFGYANDVWYSQAYLGYLSLGYLSLLYTNGIYSAAEVVNRAREVRVIAQTTLKSLYQAGNEARVQALRVAYEHLLFQANGLMSFVETPSEETFRAYEELRKKTWYALEMVKELP